jgi:plastocyanin
MTSTPDSWRVKVNKGDHLLTSGTYDVSQASWYESMAIMPLLVYKGHDQGGVDPFVSQPQTTCDSCVTHGHLAENNNHGGKTVVFRDPTSYLSGRAVDGKTVSIKNYLYALGDPSLSGIAKRPPTVKEGGTFTFKNKDNPAYEFHTITACKAPCNRDAGIAYPLADGPVDFDSGELGKVKPGIAGYAPTANRLTWNVPQDLPKGTYTYFCRVHPFMRGAFRVVPRCRPSLDQASWP